MYAAETLESFLAAEFGVQVRIEHMWACESEPWKRQWIRSHFKPACIFENIHDLHQSHAKDAITAELRPVADIDMFACGFECVSISNLNCHGSEFRGDCVQRNEGKTGTTGRSCLEFIKAHTPTVLWLENIRNLLTTSKNGKKDLDVIIEVLQSLGYACDYKILKANEYGSPQHRDRLYIWAVLVSHHSVKKADPPAWFGNIARFLDALKIEPLPLADFLFSNEHDSVRKWRAHRQQLREREALKPELVKGKTNAETVYELGHLESFLEHGLKWPPDMGSFEAVVSHLGRRQSELAFLCTHKLKDEPGETCHDLNMSATWMVEAKANECHILVSTSRPWLRKRQRDMTGDEALNLQGFDVKRQRVMCATLIDAFSNPQKFDLAGNSFCGFVVTALLLSLWCGTDWAHTCSVKARMSHMAGSDHDTESRSIADGGLDNGMLEHGESESCLSPSPAAGDEDLCPSQRSEDWAK